MDDLVLTVVADFCPLSDARRIFGDNKYIQNRSARIVTKAIRNFAGLVSAVKMISKTCEHHVDNQFFWPRAYFCTFPKPFFQNWHRPTSRWKRMLVTPYLPYNDRNRDFTRLDLFRLQKQMQTNEILAIGW
jgi:hypothetical protein